MVTEPKKQVGMNCENCGSPLDNTGETCAFCGSRNSDLPLADVPAQHQRGEAREITKTYDDSLRAIKAAVEHSDQVHKVEVRRSKIFLPLLALLLGSPMLFLLFVSYKTRPIHADFEECITSGVAAIIQGDYLQGKDFLAKAVFERNESAEGHILYGSAFYAEILEKPYLDPQKRKALVYGVYREMHFAQQTDPDNPQAHFFMGLHYYEEGETAQAVTEFEACIAYISRISHLAKRERYSNAANQILEKLKAAPTEKLVLVSQIDDSRNDREKNSIEVPYGR